MNGIVLKLLNSIYGWIVGTAVMASVAYAGYSLWDNAQIYQAAQNVQDQIRQLKPDAEAKGGPGFDELRKLNGDVVAWLTVDGTNIDYPVLQGDTNLTYMDKDVYGDFSMAGSIFLDTRNKSDFSDNYSLIYGHNMDEHLMFGDLALFKQKKFFEKNSKATLMLPGKTKDMKVAAVLQIPAGTEEIFNPDKWKDNLDGLGEFLEKNSIWYREDLIGQLIMFPKAMDVVSLVTCSDGSTNDRTVLILVRTDPLKLNKYYYLEDETPNPDIITDEESSTEEISEGSLGGGISEGSGPKPTGDSEHLEFWKALIAGILLFIVVFEVIDRYRNRHKD